MSGIFVYIVQTRRLKYNFRNYLIVLHIIKQELFFCQWYDDVQLPLDTAWQSIYNHLYNINHWPPDIAKKGTYMYTVYKKCNNIDGIIFDIDGTLWDSREQVAHGWNQAIREFSSLDVQVDLPWLKQLFGRPMTEIACILFPELEENSRALLMEQCYIYELDYLRTHPAPLYPYVAETIQELSRTYPLFIVSNCQCGYIECCIESTQIDSYITDFACFGDTNQPKNETIKLIMKRNHLKSPIYIGDIQGDADACQIAGIPIIHAAYGFGAIKEPAAVIENFRELLTLIPLLQHS